jgi:rhomboid family GlyGly-CTERM serine protease
VAAAALLAPGLTGALEYSRDQVEAGEVWRLMTGQFVHWTVRMALLDLGAVLLLCYALERRSLATAAAVVATALVAVASGFHFLMADVDRYRGASGLASALFAALALELARRSPSGAVRVVSILALFCFGLKLALEASTGLALAAGPLPPGVRSAPLIHALGAVAGATVTFASWRSGSGRPAKLVRTAA